MLLFLLQLRLRSARRVTVHLIRAEPFASVAVLVAIGFALWRLSAWSHHEGGQWRVGALNIVLLLAVHHARQDERFLRIAGVPHRRLFCAEYLLLSLPFAIPLALSSRPEFAGIGISGALLFPLLPTSLVPLARFQQLQRRTPFPLPLPVTAFEWIAGVRRIAVGVLLLYVVAVLFSGFPIVLGATLLLLALAPPMFYHDAEESTLVEVFALSPEHFLRQKVGRSVALLWALSAPVVTLFLLRHPTLWYVPLLILPICSVLLTGSILIKYAVYREGRRASVAVTLGVSLLAGTLVIPPVAALLLYRLWKQSVRNLGPYLYVFD